MQKINTDENPEWATKYGVQGIPTMLFIADGKVVYTQVGAFTGTYAKTGSEAIFGKSCCE